MKPIQFRFEPRMDYVAARLDQASISAKRLENILLFGNFKLTLNRNATIAHIV